MSVSRQISVREYENKQKKKWDMRYAARLRKWCADYCLVAGVSIDALQNYTMALSLMKQNV